MKSEALKIVVAITGASGAIYAARLISRIQELRSQTSEVSLIFSNAAIDVWEHEMGEFCETDFPFRIYRNHNFNAPMASGSAPYDVMIVCPCTAGTLGRIAHGEASALITRAADVFIKQRRRLILVLRESPYSLIHIENMRLVTLAGAIVMPACPAFYSKPSGIADLAETVTDRVLKMAGFKFRSYEWGNEAVD